MLSNYLSVCLDILFQEPFSPKIIRKCFCVHTSRCYFYNHENNCTLSVKGNLKRRENTYQIYLIHSYIHMHSYNITGVWDTGYHLYNSQELTRFGMFLNPYLTGHFLFNLTVCDFPKA